MQTGQFPWFRQTTSGPEAAMPGGAAEVQRVESLSARPATVLTLRGAAIQIAKAERVLHIAAIQNAAE
jgi:hypothetical protein